MPTVKHVKKAQQRYAMKPVLDADGKQREVPVMKNGSQAKTRHGRLVTRKLSEPDKSQPLPPRKCDAPNCPVEDKEIAIGTPFKCISIKRQYGGVTLFRHESCPTWQPWEYSDSLGAKISRVQGMDLGSETWEGEDDVTNAAQSVAEEIRALAEEKRESQQNMEDGFGHPTEQSDQLGQTADELDSWADSVEGISVPDFPEPQDGYEHPTDDELSDWRQEAEQAIRDELDNSPV